VDFSTADQNGCDINSDHIDLKSAPGDGSVHGNAQNYKACIAGKTNWAFAVKFVGGGDMGNILSKKIIILTCFY